MSAITYLTNIVTSLTNRFNQLEANSKKVDELPAQTTLEPSSKIPVSRAGESEHVTIQQIISSIQNSNYNQLTSIGAITVNEIDNEIIVEPVSGQINGNNYATTTDTTIPIVLCPSGFNRKDILVLTTSNTIIAISGEETDGAIVIAPNVPLDAIYITEFDVSDSAIGTPIDPVLGTSFKKKSESLGYGDPYLTGVNAVIQLRPEGNSRYAFSNTGLVSIDGFGLDLITGNPAAEVPYDGKDLFIENTGTTPFSLLHDSDGLADSKFFFLDETDLVVPAGGKVWLKYGPSYCEVIFKSWTDVSGKLDKSTTPSSVYATDASGNQEMKLISELGSSLESVTISNRWTLTNADVYYRSRGDFGGFNVDTLNVSTVNSTIVQVVASLSSSFYCTSKSKSLKKIYIDGSNITAALTSFKLGVFAFQRDNTATINSSAINIVNLGEFTLTKTNGHVSRFWELTPTNIEIPAGYFVSCVLMRNGGTGTEINCSMTFKFNDYVA